jgi:hypothetical protein
MVTARYSELHEGRPRGLTQRTITITDNSNSSVIVGQGELVRALQRGLSEDALQSLIEDLCDD